MRRSHCTPSVKVAPEVLTNRAQAPLGTIPIFASAPEIFEKISPPPGPRLSSRMRWWLSLRLRYMLGKAEARKEFPSLMACCAAPVPDTVKNGDGLLIPTGSPGRVAVGKYKTDTGDRHGYKWLKHCTSPMMCWICAPKIRYERGKEIENIILAMLGKGYTPVFVTYTVPHNLDTDPKEQTERFQSAQRAMKGTRAWNEFKKKYGFEHYIKATELTDDNPDSPKKTGCHYHSHCIYFFREKIDNDNIKEIDEFITASWMKAIQKNGIKIKDEVATRLHSCVVELVKPKHPTTPAKLAGYVAKTVACELSPGILTKQGRSPLRWSHWDVLAAASTKRPDLQSRAVAILRALKGKHWLDYSRGLLELCGMKKIEDKEYFKTDEKTKDIYIFDDGHHAKFSDINKYRMQAHVLEHFDQSEDDGVDAIETIVNGYDPDTGEELKTARSVTHFLETERARETSSVDGFQALL